MPGDAQDCGDAAEYTREGSRGWALLLSCCRPVSPGQKKKSTAETFLVVSV